MLGYISLRNDTVLGNSLFFDYSFSFFAWKLLYHNCDNISWRFHWSSESDSCWNKTVLVVKLTDNLSNQMKY